MTATLEHIRVIDLSQGVAGPVATKLLSQMGARVTKVERPDLGDIIRHWDAHVQGLSSGHVWVNAGKESIAIDLRTSAGQDIVRSLSADADVFVANFVPGTLERWGLGADALRELNPRLIVCLVSGFGQDSSWSQRSALDLIIQGESGLITTNGTPENPAKISLSVADLSGAMYATISILQSLLHREATGEGQTIDLSLLESVMSWTGYFPYMAWYQGQTPGRVGLHHHTMFPYGAYPTSDGRAVIVAAGAGEREHWRRFCVAIERPDLADHPDYLTNGQRLEHRVRLEPEIVAAIEARPLQHWVDRFHEVGIPAGAMNSFAEGLDHPVLKERGFEIEIPGPDGPIRAFDYPPRFSSIDHVNNVGPPVVGEHSRVVLRRAGMSAETIDQLIADGVVGDAEAT